jgi:hypothetical protein
MASLINGLVSSGYGVDCTVCRQMEGRGMISLEWWFMAVYAGAFIAYLDWTTDRDKDRVEDWFKYYWKFVIVFVIVMAIGWAIGPVWR